MKRPTLTTLRRWEARAHFLRLKSIEIYQAIAAHVGVEDQEFIPQADLAWAEARELHAILLEKLEAALAEAAKTE